MRRSAWWFFERRRAARLLGDESVRFVGGATAERAARHSTDALPSDDGLRGCSATRAFASWAVRLPRERRGIQQTRYQLSAVLTSARRRPLFCALTAIASLERTPPSRRRCAATTIRTGRRVVAILLRRRKVARGRRSPGAITERMRAEPKEKRGRTRFPPRTCRRLNDATVRRTCSCIFWSDCTLRTRTARCSALSWGGGGALARRGVRRPAVHDREPPFLVSVRRTQRSGRRGAGEGHSLSRPHTTIRTDATETRPFWSAATVTATATTVGHGGGR
uniref:Uncharacterized protein n=1 Tax=Plectus sambesii TaxID=2011161 RepID=A0A914VMH4_9BILA